VAQYSSTTAIDTYASCSAIGGNKIIRPRYLGTSTAGTAIAAVVGSGSDALTNLVTTVLSAPYERALLGGNTKVAVTAAAVSADNTVTVTLFYEPLKK
jgi:hypothetical protein